jgi:hypothetical protein
VPLWLVFLLAGLATWRLTRLLAEDTIPFVARPRAALARRSDNWDELVNCAHCVGVYVAGAVTVALWVWLDSLPAPLLVFGALAGFVSLVADYRPEKD